MKTKRFSVEQIVAVLKEAEAGMRIAELIRALLYRVYREEAVSLRYRPGRRSKAR